MTVRGARTVELMKTLAKKQRRILLWCYRLWYGTWRDRWLRCFHGA